jgi:catechol 2,3-dioxygenase-like lactoylglutathione lyase family enzyme
MERPLHRGLRHLALFAREFERMKAFYVDVLGFVIEWEPDPDNSYLSSGIDNLALHRATDRAARETALDHLGLIVGQPEDVDRWASYLQERGVSIEAPPRTHRDGARSFYFKDPDGNSVQIIYHPPISGKV